MRKAKKAFWIALPTAALLIGGGVGIAAAAGAPPAAPVTDQVQVTSTVQNQQRTHNCDHVRLHDQDRLRDGTCDPTTGQVPNPDQTQVHHPIQDRDRLHDGSCDR